MKRNLYKRSMKEWIVVLDDNKHTVSTPEAAADLLEESGVPPDEVDTALMELAGHNHSHAEFGTINGTFMFSDEEII